MQQIIKQYNEIIKQWAKALYTPKQLLQYISRYICKYHSNNFMLQFSLDDVIHIMNVTQYKFSSQFLSVINKLEFLMTKYNIKSTQNFVLVGIRDCTNIASINNMLKGININGFTASLIHNRFNEDDNPAAEAFTQKTITHICDFLCGVKIVLNRKSSKDFSNYQVVQTTLDHEFNHFFKKLNTKLDESIVDLQRVKQVQHVAACLKYDINKDFIKHMYQKSEFILMCADVCNAIQYDLKYFCQNLTNQQLYEIFLNNCQKQLLLNDSLQFKNDNLINAYLFGYICKTLDNKRWNFLCQAVKERLNII